MEIKGERYTWTPQERFLCVIIYILGHACILSYKVGTALHCGPCYARAISEGLKIPKKRQPRNNSSGDAFRVTGAHSGCDAIVAVWETD